MNPLNECVAGIKEAKEIHQEWLDDGDTKWRGGLRLHAGLIRQKDIVINALLTRNDIRRAATLLSRWIDRHQCASAHLRGGVQ